MAYLPLAHVVQLEEPVLEIVPDAQVEQDTPPVLAEKVPAVQLVQVVAAEALIFPAAQDVHTEAPAAEYVPALHVVQTLPPVSP